MATKKPASKKPGTSLTAWDEKLAARAALAKKAEASVLTGSFISLKGGQMSYMGNPVAGNLLRVIVVSSILENQLFDGEFDPNSPQSPICYAFGQDEESMQPHEAVEDPQCESCDGCPNNEWGSGKGRGKACKNVRRLALITEDAAESPEGVKDAEVAYLKLPVTSVKAWASYVNQLAALGKPPLAFITEISVTPDSQAQFKVGFKAVEELDDGDLIGAILEKSDLVDQQIAFPYQKIEAAPARPVRPAAKPAARGAAKPAARGAAKPAARGAAKPAAKPAAGRRKF